MQNWDLNPSRLSLAAWTGSHLNNLWWLPILWQMCSKTPLSYSFLISTDPCFYVTPFPLSLMPNYNLKHFQGPSYFLHLELVSSFSLAETGLSFLRVPLENLYSIINSLKTPPCQTSCLTLGKATTVSGLVSSSVSKKDDNVTLSGVPHRVVKRSKWIKNIKVCSKLQMQ